MKEARGFDGHVDRQIGLTDERTGQYVGMSHRCQWHLCEVLTVGTERL